VSREEAGTSGPVMESALRALLTRRPEENGGKNGNEEEENKRNQRNLGERKLEWKENNY